MKNYDIYKVQDGTVISMYWWISEWKMSTAKAYDATNLTWNSNITYKEIFELILNDIFNLTPNDFYSALDKKKCYSWGFNHSKYHPFWKGKIEPNSNNIWFIQSVDVHKINNRNSKNNRVNFTDRKEKLDNFSSSFTESLTDEQLISFNSPIECIHSQEQVIDNKSNININDLKLKCDNALNRYENTYIRIFEKSVSPSEPEIFFGYILRSKNPNIDKKNSNIIIESSLLKKIRKLYYNKHFKEISECNGYNRENYIILYNFINSSSHDIFQLLFPQYKKEFNKIENKIKELFNKIIRLYQNQNTIFDKNIKKNVNQNVDDSIVSDRKTNNANRLSQTLHASSTSLKTVEGRKPNSFSLESKTIKTLESETIVNKTDSTNILPRKAQNKKIISDSNVCRSETETEIVKITELILPTETQTNLNLPLNIPLNLPEVNSITITEEKNNKNNDILENIAFNIMSFIDKECIIDIENSMHEEYIKQVIKSPNMIDKLYLLCYN